MGNNKENIIGLNQTYAAVKDIVDFTIVPWGNAEVGPDGVWNCQHGPKECTGNTIEACVMHLNPEQDKWFPFVLAFEGSMELCGRGNQSATNNPEACAERIATQQGLPWAPVKACFESFDAKTGMPPKDSLGFKLEMDAKATTDALVPAHTGVPTVTAGVTGPYIDVPAQNALICFACNAYQGDDKPPACKTCTPMPPVPSTGSGSPADAQAISLFGALLYPPSLTPKQKMSCSLHLEQAKQELADDILPQMCKSGGSACAAIGTNFSACQGNFCCTIGPDAKAPQGYACQANPKLPHSAGKLINLGRRLACSGDFRQSQQAVAGCQMGGFAAGPLDTAHAFFVLGHHQISVRMLASAESTLGMACSEANASSDAGQTGITKDMPLTEYSPNADGIPTESLLGNLFYHYALTEYLLGSSAQGQGGNGKGLANSIVNWEWSLRYATGADCVLPTQDQLVSVVNWLYQAYMRSGRSADAKKTLELVSGSAMDVIEESEYYTLVQMYSGKITVAAVTKQMEAAEVSDPETFCTLAYAVGNYHYYSGDKSAAVALWKRVLATPSWAAFGYIAAEVELFNIQGVFPPPGGSR